MSSNWRKAYEELKVYIARNPGLEIGANIVCISSDVRPEFYRRFNKVRTGFVEENFAGLVEKGGVLSRKWEEASRAAIDSLKLESIDIDPDMRWFLLDPMDGLTRGLFDPLFDVLKGKQNLSEFEQAATRLVEDRFNKYYHEGYQYWATLSLLKLLATDKVYHVPPADVDKDPSSTMDETQDVYEESVPDASEISKISFTHNLMYSFMVPHIIGHATRGNFFAAFISDFDYNESRWRARTHTPERRWYEMSEIAGEFGRGKLWPDMAIYTSGHWKGLVMVADNARVAQPDIIVEFRAREGWYEKEGLGMVKRHNNVLKPKLGSFVVCLEPVPEAARKELEPKPAPQPMATGATPETTGQQAVAAATPETTVQPAAPDIHILGVGYDVTRLKPIIEAITEAQVKPEETTPAGNLPA